ncbi:MAG: transglycosylase domain-containing protein [Atopobiaceae bacterium]
MGIRTRRAHKHAKTHAVAFTIVGIFGFAAMLTIALAMSVSALVDSWLQDLPDYTSADAYLAAEPTEVYDSDGNVIAEFYLQNRRSITIDQVSQYVLEGTVDTEDVRFYQHNGVDPQGIVRAIVVQLGGGSEGASTITQQLVRNTVLSDEQFDYTIKRKVREAYIAIQMEKMYTKDQILMMYLNTIYYGHGAYGIEAASITYFNKDAANLTLAEAATLSGLPQSPSAYDPFTNPEAATERRNTVLDRMLSAGDITQEEHDEAVAEPLTLNEGTSVLDEGGKYPYWTDYVKSILSEDFDTDTIFKGGLKVYTTLDSAMQDAAEKAVSDQLNSIGNSELDSAMVAIDPSTGYIKAMVGGDDYDTDQYNVAAYGLRQPGSSFKTFTLITAIEQGMNPTVILNCSSPLQATSTWRVENYNNNNYGIISLARATELSSNTGYAQVALVVGADNIVSTAKKMGIDADLSAVPSITLGSSGVPPLQMAEAYATIASGGTHRDPVAITKIEDRNGNTVYEHEDSGEQVVDTSVTYAATQVLEGVVKSGTAASSLSKITIDQPVAGKTGTSENNRDLWMVGFTPQLSVAVWTGYRNDNGQGVTVHGAAAVPGTTSCPIFVNFLNSALAGVSREEFPEAAAPDYKPNSSWTFVGTSSAYNSGSSSSASSTSSSTSSTSSSSTSTSTTATTKTESSQTENSSTETNSSSGSGTGGSGTGGNGGNGNSSESSTSTTESTNSNANSSSSTTSQNG